MNDRKSHAVNLIDTDALLPIVADIYAATYGTDIGDDAYIPDLVVGEIPGKDDWQHDNIAVVCTEGVGWESKGDCSVLVPYDRHSSISGWGYIKVGTNRIWNECRSDKTIDLADFIRKFGARLDYNHHLWHSRFTDGDTKS